MPLSIHILGAGVVGLTTALKIQETYPDAQVTVIAEIMPGDAKSIRYTSIWAGAHHVSEALDERQNIMDRETFKIMWEMSAPGTETEHLFLRQPQTEFYVKEEKIRNYNLNVMPDYRVLDKSELRLNTTNGIAFTTLTIDTPLYLEYLLKKFTSAGGILQRSSVQHISQVIDGAYSSSSLGQSPDAVVVCLGLGAFSLGGVEDKDVYPIRGQTVLIDAPWVRFGRSHLSSDGLLTYIIPRRSGGIIVGGIKDANDWYPHARPEVTEDILTRALALCPELVSPEINFATSPQPTIEQLRPQILEENCGFRPSRKGGIRLEVEEVKSTKRLGLDEKNVVIVHNYGHGGYGYQSSWGSATMAVDLLKSKFTP